MSEGAGLDIAAAFAAHAARTTFADLPPDAVAKAKTFLLDTLGVGLAGSSGASLAELLAVVRGWGGGEEATVWAGGARLPAPSAAIVNAYLIHCLEYDCVHEGAVVHPMATILSALLAWCEREARRGRPVDGRRLLAALAVGVDVATLLGVATRAPVRFFRPATAGGFGATAAVANLAGFDELRTRHAFGAMYAQTSGTLQPHAEGSVMLGLQIGFNARGAIGACDLVAGGLAGPLDVFTGPYGYFRLMEEGSVDPGAIERELGRRWQITRLSHKPYPSGRLTHGVVDGLRRLQEMHGFAAAEVAAVTARVPPLVFRLVGRPDIPDPEPNYAKLCLAFVAGAYLARGRVDVPEFRDEAARRDPAVHAQAAKVRVVEDDNPDQNALDPQTIEVALASGAWHAVTLPQVYGHPEAAVTEAENLDKFRRCCGYAVPPVPPKRAERIVGLVAALETLDDVAVLIRAMTAG